jgi:hypothetical protein
MSETLRFSELAQCSGKRGYSSKRVAKRSARRAETKLGGGHLDVYRCDWCRDPVSGRRYYHAGHRPHPDALAAARLPVDSQDPYVVLPLSALADLLRHQEPAS